MPGPIFARVGEGRPVPAVRAGRPRFEDELSTLGYPFGQRERFLDDDIPDSMGPGPNVCRAPAKTASRYATAGTMIRSYSRWVRQPRNGRAGEDRLEHGRIQREVEATA